MNSYHLFVAAFLGLCVVPHVGAAVREEWVARYHLAAGGDNRAVTMALDTHGNIIVGGQGTSTNGDLDYVVLKYSPAGQLLWQETFGTATNDTIRSMALDGSDNIVVTGTSGTVKWNSNGVHQWTSELGGRAVAVGREADWYITGFQPDRYATARIDGQFGTNIWIRTFKYLDDPSASDTSQAIAIDSNSNVVVSGYVNCSLDRVSSYLGRMSMSYDNFGNQRWRTEPFPVECQSYHVNIVALGFDASNNVYSVGNLDVGGSLFSVFKERPTGQSVWVSAPDNAGAEGATAGISDLKGNTVVTGRRNWMRVGNVAFQTFAINAAGELVWIRRYSGEIDGYHRANTVGLDSHGSTYVAGQSPGITTRNDFATLKYSTSGEELWVQRYDGPAHGDDVATAIAVAPDGSVYVTGWSTTSSNLVEITTIKYAQTASLTVESNRQVSLQFPAAPGASNRVQATTNFLQWLDLGFSVADTNGLLHFLDTNAPNNPFRFYRTVSP